MAQFTVYRNKNPCTKATCPLLVDVQSDLLEDLQTRVVIPLSKAAAFAKKPVSHLTPILKFEGEAYTLMTPELAGVARNDLGAVAGSLAERRDAILAALKTTESSINNRESPARPSSKLSVVRRKPAGQRQRRFPSTRLMVRTLDP